MFFGEVKIDHSLVSKSLSGPGQNESEDRRREDLTTTNARTYSQPQEDEERDKDGHETDIQSEILYHTIFMTYTLMRHN